MIIPPKSPLIAGFPSIYISFIDFPILLTVTSPLSHGYFPLRHVLWHRRRLLFFARWQLPTTLTSSSAATWVCRSRSGAMCCTRWLIMENTGFKHESGGKWWFNLCKLVNMIWPWKMWQNAHLTNKHGIYSWFMLDKSASNSNNQAL